MSDPDLDLIPQLRDYLFRDPAGLAIAFDAMRRATPDHARWLLRDLAAPHGQIDTTFVKELFEFHGILATTMRLLGAFNKLDRGLVKEIFRSVVGTHQLNGHADHIIDSLIAVIEAPSVGLSETLAFIDLIRRCHHELGKALFDSFISRPTYKQKKQMLIDAIGSVPEAVKCCRPLRLLSPKHFTAFVNEFLRQDSIETALVDMANTHGAFRLLRELRTVHPRLAVSVLWKLWRTRSDWCKTTMMWSADIVDAVGLLLAVASIDRRIAIEFGHSYEDFLCRLVEAESDQFRLASAVDRIASVSFRLASTLAMRVNYQSLLDRIRTERHRMALSGRALSSYAVVCPRLTSAVIRELELSDLYLRVDWRAFLYNFVFLTRGILDARRADTETGEKRDPVAEFIMEVRKDAQIMWRLRESMNCSEGTSMGSIDLREIAVAFALMTESGVPLDDLFRLYGIANQAEMVNRARCWVRSASDIIGVRQFLYAMMLLSDECYSQEALSVVSEVVKQRRRPAVGSEPIGEPRRIGRIARTGTVAQGMELSDIVEIGDLLRLAGAIDEDAAADLVREFNPRRLAGLCARDQNLGRHEELLRGLYGASRLSCLELVRQVYGDEVRDEALAVLLEENESSDNVLGLVRRLQIIAPPTAVRIFKLNFELGQERFLTLLGVEANLHNASRWLRTCYGYPGIMPGQIRDDIVQIMHEMLIYDERLFSAVEATVALVDAERPSDTEPFVSAIIKEAQQAAALRSPVGLIGLVLRLMRIDQALNGRCLDAVLEHIKPDALYKFLSISESIVLASFTYNLFRHHVSAYRTRYAQVLDEAREDLRLRIRQSTISSTVLISAMLLDEETDEFLARLRSVSIDDLRQFRPWEIGLIETIYAAIYQDTDCRLFVDRDLLSGLDHLDRDDVLARRRRYLEGDVSNVKCALSTRSSWDREHLGLGKASFDRIMADRRNYDTRNAVLLLLDAGFQTSELSKYPYYLKVLLDETVFARSRFNWSPRIITEVHSQRFAAA